MSDDDFLFAENQTTGELRSYDQVRRLWGRWGYDRRRGWGELFARDLKKKQATEMRSWPPYTRRTVARGETGRAADANVDADAHLSVVYMYIFVYIYTQTNMHVCTCMCDLKKIYVKKRVTP